MTDAYQTPGSDVSVDSGVAEQMTLKEIYFSFEGRVPRKVFWLHGVLAMMGYVLVLLLVAGGLWQVSGALGAIVAIAGLVILIWASLAVQVKRWHDRDKSGWWVLLPLIPFIVGIWQLVETGFLEGSNGSNRFGPHPAEY